MLISQEGFSVPADTGTEKKNNGKTKLGLTLTKAAQSNKNFLQCIYTRGKDVMVISTSCGEE